MDESVVRQIVDELISSLEPMETQIEALVQFVKDKGIADDAALAPYLERAANASDVRWRAFRLRTLSLISSALKTPEKEEKEPAKSPAKSEEKNASAQRAGSGQENLSPGSEPGAERHHHAAPSAENAGKAEPKEQKETQSQESHKPGIPGQKDAA